MVCDQDALEERVSITVDDIRGAMLKLGPCKAKQLARALEVTVREVNPLLYRNDDVFSRSTDVPPIFELRNVQAAPRAQHSPSSAGAERQSAPADDSAHGWTRGHELQVGRLRLDVASARAEVPARLRDQDAHDALLRQADADLDAADAQQDPQLIGGVEDLLRRAWSLTVDVSQIQVGRH